VNRGKVVRAVLAVTILVISVVFVLTESPRLGLDLRGGTQITLETRNSPAVKADREATERTVEVLRLRVDALGVAEPAIAQSGERRIIVELPGVNDAGQAAAVLGARRSSPSTRFSARRQHNRLSPHQPRGRSRARWC
jgi:SecD/SecF fusion protein